MDAITSQRLNVGGADSADDAMEREEVSHLFSLAHKPESMIEDKEDDNDNEDDTSAMEEDVFTMLFVSPVYSKVFWYSLFIIIVQMAILALALINSLKDPDPDRNILMIPPYTELEVNLSQLIALLISVMVSDDVISSLDVLLLRYDPNISETFKHATFPKWVISHICRFVEGVLGITVAFIFIVQSTDVLALFLDFSVVQFVSELDNVGFHLADKGYLPIRNIQRVTKKISDTRIRRHLPIDECEISKNKRRFRRAVQIGIFYSLVVILYGFWGTIKIQQSRGVFFQMECQRIHVVLPDFGYDNFFKRCLVGIIGDDCDVDGHWVNRSSQKVRYPYFNGIYVAETTEDGALETIDHRPVYKQTLAGNSNFGDAVSNPPGMFRYCEKEEAWIFTIPGVSKGANADDCSWLLKSPETEVLSLNDVPEGDWQVWTGIIDEAPVDLTCAECVGEELAEEQTGDIGCNFHGKCLYKNRTCECDPGYIGAQCSSCVDCNSLRLISETPQMAEIARQFPGILRRLDNEDSPVEMYGRPVLYLSTEETGEAVNPLLVAFYWGDRYVLWDFSDRVHWWGRRDQKDQLVEIFQTLHPLWGYSDKNKHPSFLTERTTLRDTPAGLRWKSYDSYVKNPDFNEGYFRLYYECVDNDHGGIC